MWLISGVPSSRLSGALLEQRLLSPVEVLCDRDELVKLGELDHLHRVIGQVEHDQAPAAFGELGVHGDHRPECGGRDELDLLEIGRDQVSITRVQVRLHLRNEQGRFMLVKLVRGHADDRALVSELSTGDEGGCVGHASIIPETVLL